AVPEWTTNFGTPNSSGIYPVNTVGHLLQLAHSLASGHGYKLGWAPMFYFNNIMNNPQWRWQFAWGMTDFVDVQGQFFMNYSNGGPHPAEYNNYMTRGYCVKNGGGTWQKDTAKTYPNCASGGKRGPVLGNVNTDPNNTFFQTSINTSPQWPGSTGA